MDPSNPALRKKTWPWWHASFGDKLSSYGRKLLEDCGVQPEEVDNHIYCIRDQAWEVFPFPCIGEFWFLEFGLTHHPEVRSIIQVLQSAPAQATARLNKQIYPSSFAPVIADILAHPESRRLLDLGTCVGQDLRVLRRAGVSVEALYGCDLFPEFETIGHAMFLDKDAFHGRFFAADVFSDDIASPLNSTYGCWDVVTATMFLHQFDRAQQRAIAMRMVRLLRDEVGAMIVGNNTGQVMASEIPLRPPFVAEGEKRAIFRQSKETMVEMWEDVLHEFEQRSGRGDWRERWSVWCEYDVKQIQKREEEVKKHGEVRFFQGGEQRRIIFCIKRV